MSTTGTDITDITWSDMTRAGIDIDLVRRQHTETGEDEYVLLNGDFKIAFGPAVDLDDGGTNGYSIACYDRDDMIRQDWAGTVDELLRIVAEAIEGTTPGKGQQDA